MAKKFEELKDQMTSESQEISKIKSLELRLELLEEEADELRTMIDILWNRMVYNSR